MLRQKKEETVALMAEIFRDNEVGFLVDFRGMDVASITELRRRLHQAGTSMRVLKNRMAKIAVKGTPFEALGQHMTETRGLLFGKDPVAPAKVILKYRDEHEKFKLIGGLLVKKDRTGALLDEAQIKALGSLPPREELIGKVLFLMKAPQTQFVRVLHEVPAKLVRTLDAVRDAKQKATG